MALTIVESTKYEYFQYRKRATSGGTVFVNVGGPPFDFFEDACVVDDAFYFAWQKGRWRTARLFVGTAFAAAAVTFAWEYWNGSAWAALPDLVDGTANFTALGQGDVTFTVPTDWRYCTVAGSYAYFVRVRISAVTAPTEGGANFPTSPQFRHHEILVTGVDEVNDVFQAIYDADQAAGWGHTSLSNRGIQVNCNIGIGDGTTLTSAVSTNEYVCIQYDDFYVRNNATLRCGILHANGYTYNGSVILHAGKGASNTTVCLSGCTALFYDSRLIDSGDYKGRRRIAYGGNVTFQDTTMANFTRFCPQAPTVNLKRFRLKSMRLFGNNIGTVEDFYIQGEDSKLCTLVGPMVAVGLVVESGLAKPYRGYAITTAELIDSGTDPLDAGKWTWGSNGVGTYLLVRYTFNLRVVDADGTGISGVTVAMADANGDAVFSVVTDGSGDIAEQRVTRVRYDRVTSGTMAQTDYGPGFTVTLSKAGYPTRTVVYEIDRKREEIEQLLPKGPKKDIEGNLYMEINSVGDLLRIAA